MTAEEQHKTMVAAREAIVTYRRALFTATKERNEAQTKLTGMTRLGTYYSMRYHDTRRALVACRLDILGLESMVEALQKRLGDKGLDIDLASDDLDVR